MAVKTYALPCGKIYVNHSDIEQGFYIKDRLVKLKPHQVFLEGGSHVDLMQYMMAPAFWESKTAFENLLKKEGYVNVLVDISKVDRWGDSLMLTLVPKGYAQFHQQNVAVDVLVHPKVADVWIGNPYIRAVYTEMPPGKYEIMAELNNLELTWETKKNCASTIMERAGLHTVNKTPVYCVTKEERSWAVGELHDVKRPIIGLAGLSSAAIRTWPHMSMLAKELQTRGYHVLILDQWGETDQQEFRYSFREMGALIEQCDAVVANDSAVLHLAGALHKRLFGIFGHTDGKKVCENYEKAVVIQSKYCKEVPCWWKVPCVEGANYRVKENAAKDVACLKHLSVKEVADTIDAELPKAKKILAVMLTYNMLSWTKLAIDSLRTRHDCDLIVVDNDSDDGTQAWLEKQGIKFVSTRQSVAAAQNDGLDYFFKGKYDYMLLLNNDIALRHDTIDKLVESMERSRGFGGITAQEMMNISPWVVDETEPMSANENACEIPEIPTSAYSCTIFRRSMLEKVGIFDEHFTPRYIEDNDYTLRMRMAGYKFGKVKHAIYYHLVGGVLTTNELEKRDRDIHWIKNIAYYQEKWNIGPHEVQDLEKLTAETRRGELVRKIDERLKTKPSCSVLINRLFGGIGDVIFVGIVGRELKRKYGNKVKVYYHVCAHDHTSNQKEVLKGLPYIDGFDQSADFTLELTEVDFRAEWQDCALHGEIVMPRTALHLDIAGLLNDKTDLKPDYKVMPDEAAWAEKFWQQMPGGKKRVVVSPAGSNNLKRWHDMGDLINALKQNADYKVYTDTPKHTFRQLAAIISRAHLVISPDSAPSNVAGALDVPVIAIFSNRNGELFARMFPSMIPLNGHCPLGLHHCDYKIPCAGTEGPYRPKENGIGEPGCLRNLTVEEVMEVADEVLA